MLPRKAKPPVGVFIKAAFYAGYFACHAAEELLTPINEGVLKGAVDRAWKGSSFSSLEEVRDAA